MPNAKGTYEFHEIMWTDKQTQFRRYDYNRSIAVACNLALTVNYVHSKGYVIGDMNIKNFRFDRECHVIVLDVDSFDVTDKQTGAHYKCCVGCPDVLAPELQGLRLDTERAKFTKQTDYFSLAILIFMFLMNGAHPFNAPKITTASGYSSSASDNGIMVDIANGNCPYVRLNTGRQVPKRTLQCSRRLSPLPHIRINRKYMLHLSQKPGHRALVFLFIKGSRQENFRCLLI